MYTKKWIAEADRQLSNTTNYKKQLNDSALQHKKLVNDTINRFKKENCYQVTLSWINYHQSQNTNVGLIGFL